MRQAELFVQANQAFNDYVAVIGNNWSQTVPSTPDWTVRQLVNHVAHNNLDLVAYLQGEPAESAEDVLGDDPVAAWTKNAQSTEDAAGAEADPARDVDGPMGPMTAGDILLMQTVDRVIHGWDLARAVGADDAIEPGLCQAAYDFIIPRAEDARQAGMFGPEIPVASSASVQDKLLALTGRDSSAYEPEPDGTDESKADVIHRSS